MKALRKWMKSSEEAREIFKDSQERAIPAKAGDQMRDIIMVMADALETIANHGSTHEEQLKMTANELWEQTGHDRLADIATAAREKVEEIVG